jgi:hypothetical protein
MQQGPQDGKPTPSEIRQDARRLLDEISATADRGQRRTLAVRAFELAQLAEQLEYESLGGAASAPRPAGPD